MGCRFFYILVGSIIMLKSFKFFNLVPFVLAVFLTIVIIVACGKGEIEGKDDIENDRLDALDSLFGGREGDRMVMILKSSSSVIELSSSVIELSSSVELSSSSESSSSVVLLSSSSVVLSSSAADLYDLSCRVKPGYDTGSVGVNVPVANIPEVTCKDKVFGTVVLLEQLDYLWKNSPNKWLSPPAGTYDSIIVEIDNTAKACQGKTAKCEGVFRICPNPPGCPVLSSSSGVVVSSSGGVDVSSSSVALSSSSSVGLNSSSSVGLNSSSSVALSSSSSVVSSSSVSTYTVTWNADGGSPVPTQTSVTHGGSITQPATMTKTGYTFGGWFTNSTLTTAASFPITNVTANTALWAKWTALTYTITFDANGGTVTPTSGTTGADGKLASLPIPTRANYTFNGWFTAATGGTAVTTSTVFNAAAIIYAQWTSTVTGTPITIEAGGNENNGTHITSDGVYIITCADTNKPLHCNRGSNTFLEFSVDGGQKITQTNNNSPIQVMNKCANGAKIEVWLKGAGDAICKNKDTYW